MYKNHQELSGVLDELRINAICGGVEEEKMALLTKWYDCTCLGILEIVERGGFYGRKVSSSIEEHHPFCGAAAVKKLMILDKNGREYIESLLNSGVHTNQYVARAGWVISSGLKIELERVLVNDKCTKIQDIKDAEDRVFADGVVKILGIYKEWFESGDYEKAYEAKVKIESLERGRKLKESEQKAAAAEKLRMGASSAVDELFGNGRQTKKTNAAGARKTDVGIVRIR